MAPSGSGTSGVDWSQAMGVFRALLFSPVVGFIFAALMLLVMKLVIRNKALYAAPTSDRPPPAWIRGLLILTCGVDANVVRLLTPLTASDMVLKEGLDILEAAITGN